MMAFVTWASRYLDRQPRSTLSLLAFVLTLFLGMLDYLLGPEISFSIFYLLPSSLAAWFIGRRVAMFICGLSAVTWLWADLAAGHVYTHAATPYWNATVRLGFFLIVSTILVHLRRALEGQTALARTDGLTGAANSRAFAFLAEAEILRQRRFGRPLTLAYVDVDDFKTVNDRLGHSAGDMLLQSIARTLRESLRDTDCVARLGGDEFAILLPETPTEGAAIVIRNLQSRLQADLRGRGWPVTFSVGVATFLNAPASADEAIKTADALMYRAKHAGKNQVLHEVVGGPPAPA